MDPSLSPAKRPIQRVALACIQCRSRKVRCDATLPTCRRCIADGKACEYQKSRRGGRPRRLAAAPLQVNLDHSPSGDSLQSANIGGASTDSSSSGHGSTGSSAQSVCDSLDIKCLYRIVLSGGPRLTRIHADQLLTQYYIYFHISHPCVLPRWSLQSRMVGEPAISDYLIPVLLYIGSIFTHSIDSAPLAETALQAIHAGRAIGYPNAYHTQALVLYSIAVYWCDEPERGRELLDEAIEGAFVLGMHEKGFASQHGLGDPVLEESWRRTWWQIYITDTHISGSLHTYRGLSTKFPSTAELPCEEREYESGNIPTPTTLLNYNAREFSEIEFSSFAQLIGFTQGINRVLAGRRLEDTEGAKTICANADTMMTAWCSLLPAQKRTLLHEDGTVDELLFKANILVNVYIVDLHRQLSSLKYSAIESVSKCAPPPPPESNDNIKEEAHMHTAKALFATERLNGLLTLPTRFSTHTPFIICMIANMTIAHLSACRYIFQEPRLSLEREKIRLNMGVLKMLGEFWPAGQREYQSMGTIAREMLALKEEEIQIPTETAAIPLDTLNFNFDFDINWACDAFVNGSNPFINDLLVL
ncbi:hypothetical protein K458DRAFT_392044 [Lentithecium fluviatile CBS 122367]|uniref:Zn(2)-C6 fungal-type domain-containing protein n=1 Tax=Lentithecium fluviatile CBS 122367 TaxID=1168545 RepID=A0A6G1ISN1_9PLEO|nr:hypothetical protein K458DRAFT_392044 [Lentithecium fluviatile CBS 122367]